MAVPAGSQNAEDGSQLLQAPPAKLLGFLPHLPIHLQLHNFTASLPDLPEGHSGASQLLGQEDIITHLTVVTDDPFWPYQEINPVTPVDCKPNREHILHTDFSHWCLLLSKFSSKPTCVKDHSIKTRFSLFLYWQSIPNFIYCGKAATNHMSDSILITSHKDDLLMGTFLNRWYIHIV